MKRHLDDMSQKNKRFSYNNDNRYNDNRSPLHPSPQSAGRPPSRDGGGGGGGGGGSGSSGGRGGSGSFFSYSSSMWVDPRSDSKGHSNMNVFQPQNVMMQWTNPKYDFHAEFLTFHLTKFYFSKPINFHSLIASTQCSDIQSDAATTTIATR